MMIRSWWSRLSEAVRRKYSLCKRCPRLLQLAALAGALAAFHFSRSPALLLTVFCSLWLEAGLLLAVACFPTANIYKQVGASIYTPLEALIVACALAWGVRRVARIDPSGFRIPKGLALDWAVLAFVAVSALSLLAAENLPAGQWALRILVIEPALLYLLVRIHRLYFRPTATDESLVASGQGVGLLHLADALVLGAVSVSVIGLGQYFFSDYVEAVEGVRRILSIYDSPNHLGLFLGRTIPLLIAAIAFAADRRRRIAYGLALLPVMAALYLTFSRGAWLVGLPAGLLTIGLLADGQRLLAGRRIRIAVLASLLVLVLALLALLPFVGTTRFASLFDLQTGTSFNRLLIWQGSLRLIAAHPLWGVGIGNFVTQYPRYMLPAAWREPVIYHAHDFVLDFWAMLGLPGLAALAWLLITFFRAALPAYRRLGESTAHVTDPDLKALTLGLIASMVNFMAHGLVDTGYFLTDLAFVFMLTLALGGRLAQAALTR